MTVDREAAKWDGRWHRDGMGVAPLVVPGGAPRRVCPAARALCLSLPGKVLRVSGARGAASRGLWQCGCCAESTVNRRSGTTGTGADDGQRQVPATPQEPKYLRTLSRRKVLQGGRQGTRKAGQASATDARVRGPGSNGDQPMALPSKGLPFSRRPLSSLLLLLQQLLYFVFTPRALTATTQGVNCTPYE